MMKMFHLENLINAVKYVLPSKSTTVTSTAKTSQKKKTSGNSENSRVRRPYPRDENGKIFLPANQLTGQKNKIKIIVNYTRHSKS